MNELKNGYCGLPLSGYIIIPACKAVILAPSLSKYMPKIKFLPHPEYCPEGQQFDSNTGTTIIAAAARAGIHIEHACEKSCACTTCHVVVREGFASLAESSEDEDDLLDKAWGLEPTSRLSCQAVIGDSDLVIEIPKYNINQVSERH